MKTEYYTNKWLRKVEIVAMVVATIFPPLPLFFLAIKDLQSSGSISSNFIIGIALIISGLTYLIFFGIIFGNSFKHYIYHQETRDDVIIARVSPLLILGSIFVFYIFFSIS